MMGSTVRAFAPGRVEIAGNHTDHQQGVVVAGAVSLGVSAQARLNGTNEVRAESEGYDPFVVDISDLQPRDQRKGTSESLVRGVIDAFSQRGVKVEGFDVQFDSTVPAGSGLSSSAAFELAVAVTLNTMFADGQFDPVELAKMSMYAERVHFGKPCGLMDQLASSCGGIVEVDFENPDCPAVTPVDFNIKESGYALVLVDSRCDHSQFTDEFSAIPNEMCSVAQLFGKEKLRQVPEGDFWENLSSVRSALGDRAALRAMHFFSETKSAQQRAQALRDGDMLTFLRLTNESGISSAELLQNVSFWGASQPAAVVLAVVRHVLAGEGACRIHGGGFGGCIQVFVPDDRLASFVEDIEVLLGRGSCLTLDLGHEGAKAYWE